MLTSARAGGVGNKKVIIVCLFNFLYRRRRAAISPSFSLIVQQHATGLSRKTRSPIGEADKMEYRRQVFLRHSVKGGRGSTHC